MCSSCACACVVRMHSSTTHAHAPPPPPYRRPVCPTLPYPTLPRVLAMVRLDWRKCGSTLVDAVLKCDSRSSMGRGRREGWAEEEEEEEEWEKEEGCEEANLRRREKGREGGREGGSRCARCWRLAWRRRGEGTIAGFKFSLQDTDRAVNVRHHYSCAALITALP